VVGVCCVLGACGSSSSNTQRESHACNVISIQTGGPRVVFVAIKSNDTLRNGHRVAYVASSSGELWVTDGDPNASLRGTAPRHPVNDAARAFDEEIVNGPAKDPTLGKIEPDNPDAKAALTCARARLRALSSSTPSTLGHAP
jgi:hypothetical protein